MSLSAYDPALAPLLERPELNELGPGRPDPAIRPRLEALTVESFGGRGGDSQMAKACLAGLWLLHDFLEESHEISQDIPTATGSCWHGIMHRREGDFGNAKYWFCRAGVHPIFRPLAQKAAELPAGHREPRLAFLQRQQVWDPNLFIDLCEESLAPASPHSLLACRLQRLEWDLLFDYCYRHARPLTPPS